MARNRRCKEPSNQRVIVRISRHSRAENHCHDAYKVFSIRVLSNGEIATNRWQPRPPHAVVIAEVFHDRLRRC